MLNSLLRFATKQGYGLLAWLLIKSGANPDSEYENGMTPLQIAAQHGYADVCSVLLRSGADPNSVNSFNGITALWTAAQHGHDETVFTLLQWGANPNLPASFDQSTPLWVATQQGYTKLCLALLKAGANPNAADSRGITPIWVAAERGHTEVAVALLKRGADPYQGPEHSALNAILYNDIKTSLAIASLLDSNTALVDILHGMLNQNVDFGLSHPTVIRHIIDTRKQPLDTEVLLALTELRAVKPEFNHRVSIIDGTLDEDFAIRRQALISCLDTCLLPWYQSGKLPYAVPTDILETVSAYAYPKRSQDSKKVSLLNYIRLGKMTASQLTVKRVSLL